MKGKKEEMSLIKQPDLDGPPLVEMLPLKQPRRRYRRVLGLAVVMASLAFLSLIAFQLLTPKQNAGSSSPLIGHTAPDFTLPVLSQRPEPDAHLARWKGQVVMINFWASWCDPCKHEAPLLQRTWLQVKDQGVTFLGVDYGDTQRDGLAFLHQYGISYPNVFDAKSSVAIDYGVAGVPETFFVNRQGVIVRKEVGELSAAGLQEDLRQLGVALPW